MAKETYSTVFHTRIQAASFYLPVFICRDGTVSHSGTHAYRLPDRLPSLTLLNFGVLILMAKTLSNGRYIIGLVKSCPIEIGGKLTVSKHA